MGVGRQWVNAKEISLTEGATQWRDWRDDIAFTAASELV
jgi:hypothetical protein